MKYFNLICLFLLFSCHQQTNPDDNTTICQKLKPLTQTKHAIQAGEWRASFSETHEPLQTYISRNPTRATSIRNKLYVVKIGAFDKRGTEILENAKLYLKAFYQIEVQELPVITTDAIPEKYTRPNTYGLQLQTPFIIDSLLPKLLPDSAFALIAFTKYDLYPSNDWNYVFGIASLEKRVGVWSLARFGDYNQDSVSFHLALQRTLKVASHETGHLFGIKHCVQNECCMNGGISLEESDQQPLWLCWECTAKVCWNRNIFPDAQIQALLNFHKSITKSQPTIQYYQQALHLLQQ